MLAAPWVGIEGAGIEFVGVEFARMEAWLSCFGVMIWRMEARRRAAFWLPAREAREYQEKAAT